jgi:hypothetical protein
MDVKLGLSFCPEGGGIDWDIREQDAEENM